MFSRVVSVEWLLCVALTLIAFDLAHISYRNFTVCPVSPVYSRIVHILEKTNVTVRVRVTRTR